MSWEMLCESNFLSGYCLARGKHRRGEYLFRDFDFHIWIVLQSGLVSDQLNFNPQQTFDETKHQSDAAASEYLGKAASDVRHLVPVAVAADGNCLYHSIVLLMDTTVVTASELRGMTVRFLSIEFSSLSRNVSVRTVIELVKNENFYAREYSQFVGPVQNALKTACKNYNYSELFEIVALCTLLQCNIRSVYPNIDFRDDMMIANRIFTPVPPIHTNYQITILWSHANREIDARALNNGAWSPNHFVPLLSRPEHSQESDHRNQSTRTATVSFFLL
jgi:OTU-like cysteine protease